MSLKSRPRFDPHTLRDLAGVRAFTRGQAYFRDEMVDILGVQQRRVLARVGGTEDYRTVVTGQAGAIDGECSCPAFERDGVCKHMVAVALTVSAAVAGGKADASGTLAQISGLSQDQGRAILWSR